MKINHISASRKQVFDLCPQKYKYQYHLEVSSSQEEPFYFTYGTIIHKIAEDYVAERGNKVLAEIVHDVLSGKVELEPGRKAPILLPEYRSKLPGHLAALKRLTDKLGFDGYLEYEFRYDLDPPHNRIITGYIDRLIVKDDHYWIVDYKTTKEGPWRKTPRNIAADLQLRCYARVVQKKFNAKAENITAALYYLEGPELIAVKFSDETLQAVEREMLQTYMEIHGADPDKVWGRVGDWCKRCEFKRICPFYSLV